MKRLLIILLALTFLLMGCDPGMAHLDGEELLQNTVRIELVHYENTSPKLIRRSDTNVQIFDFGKVTPIAVLDVSLIEDVVTDMAQQDLLLFSNTLNEPIGKTVLLYQSDGSMIVMFGCVYQTKRGGKRYYGECNLFDENGVFVDYLGDISSEYVDRLEAKYFTGGTN